MARSCVRLGFAAALAAAVALAPTGSVWAGPGRASRGISHGHHVTRSPLGHHARGHLRTGRGVAQRADREIVGLYRAGAADDGSLSHRRSRRLRRSDLLYGPHGGRGRAHGVHGAHLVPVHVDAPDTFVVPDGGVTIVIEESDDGGDVITIVID